MMRDSSPGQLRFKLPAMARLDLTDDEREVLVRTLRQIVGDHCPLSPRIRCLRQILEKLEPSAAAVEPLPAPRSHRPSRPTRRGGSDG